MATYGSYTYGHTVSLHYALPLLHRRPRRVGHRFDGGKFEPGFLHRITDRVVRSRDSAVEQRCFDEAGDDIAHLDPVRRPRSEEHTSELQSLMRSSYAVVCLTKNKSHNAIRHNYKNIPTNN